MKTILKSIRGFLTEVWEFVSLETFKGIKWLIYEWNEFITIPVAMVLFIVLPPWLRRIDPEAGEFDIGILNAVMLAILSGLIILGVTWFVLKIMMPGLYKYLDSVDEGLNHMTEWEKVKLSLGFFALILVTFLVLVSAIL